MTGRIQSCDGITPVRDPLSFDPPDAVVIGEVPIGAACSVRLGAVCCAGISGATP